MLYLDYITNDQFSNLYLLRSAASDDTEHLFSLDSILQAPELPLLGPVVKGRDQDHDDHRDENCHAFDPGRMVVLLWVWKIVSQNVNMNLDKCY